MEKQELKDEDLRNIWVAWSEKFLTLPQKPMSSADSGVFVMCSFHEKDKAFPGKGIEDSFLYKVVDKRAKFYGLELTPAVTTMVASLSDSPGTAVMYVVVMKYYAVKEGLSRIGMDEFARMLPMGYPSKDHLSKIWDEQKGFANGIKGVDNILDTLRVEMMHL